jgi:hypothetical protein
MNERKKEMLSSFSSLRELMWGSRYPLGLYGPESPAVLRGFEHRQALKEMRDADRRAKRELNAADRAERGWLARRLGLARD